MRRRATIAEVCWLAGWLEGEGTFLSHVTKDRGYRRAIVRAVSTDKDTLERVQASFGGIINGPYQYGTNRQPHWHWIQAKRLKARALMRLLRPLMSARRQIQIDRALEVSR